MSATPSPTAETPPPTHVMPGTLGGEPRLIDSSLAHCVETPQQNVEMSKPRARDQAAAVQLLGTPCADEAALDRGLAGVLRMWSGMDRDASASDREELVDAMKDLDRAPDRRPPSDT